MKPKMKSPSTLPSPVVDFNDDSNATSPYATAPSSPQSTIPFFWEHKPGIPKQNHHDHFPLEFDTDFAFGYLERHSISAADELFDCGKIKPLKPPPRLHCSNTSPKPSKSPKSRLKDALSPKPKPKTFDPFSEAFKQSSCDQTLRGRNPTTKTNRSYKLSRSLSPFRVPGMLNNRKNSSNESSASGLTWYNKWNFKNMLLFRNVSDESVVKRGDDSLNKYTVLQKDETMIMKVPYKSGLMGCLRS